VTIAESRGFGSGTLQVNGRSALGKPALGGEDVGARGHASAAEFDDGVLWRAVGSWGLPVDEVRYVPKGAGRYH
jgi:hypothetical protein